MPNPVKEMVCNGEWSHINLVYKIQEKNRRHAGEFKGGDILLQFFYKIYTSSRSFFDYDYLKR